MEDVSFDTSSFFFYHHTATSNYSKQYFEIRVAR